MTRQELAQRTRKGLAAVRARISFRLIRRAVLLGTALGLLVVAAEAFIRGKLPSPQSRAPTALYTRPVPWHSQEGEPRLPIAIGTLDGSALEQRIPLRLSQLPDNLVQAVVAIEDQRFYKHHGLDFKRIGGALLANLRAGGFVQGGSTITQQLAKNLYLSASRDPLRKLREAALALALEARYSKSQILEAYLNEIYLGQDGARAIHGVGAASRYYFGRDARRLSLGEAAMLAGMISAPNRTAPNHNPELARQRRDLVLQIMVDQKRITRTTAARVTRNGVAPRAYPARVIDGRYFRDFASPAIKRGLPARGVSVYTTLDARLQRAAERAIQSAGRAGGRAAGAEAALVALDPRTGEILALVGGRDYGTSQFNRATAARRQPGSAFKPIVAVAALERFRGRDPAFTLASALDDEPLSVSTPAGLWEPLDYDGQFRGSVTLREAMEQSLNVPFARIGLAIGPDRIAATGARFGISSPLRAVPSLALGSSEVTLLELVRAYGVLAAGGQLADPQTLSGVARNGDTLATAPVPHLTRVVDPAVAYLVTSMLQGVVERGTGRALNESGRFGAIAGKTGTSNDWRDAWFIAYSPALVVGAWVGFDDGRSVGLTGAGAALPIVASFLAEASTDGEGDSFEVPDGITEGYVTLAGNNWGSDCGTREYFLSGTEPSEGGCFPFAAPHNEPPHWDLPRQWGREPKRRASRILEAIGEQLEELRGHR